MVYLPTAYRRKIREEERASGISTPELTEVEQALEDLIVREDEADRDQQETAAQKRKVKEDKKDAEEVRKRAMERLGDRMKRSEIEGKGKKRRSSGNNTLEYLKERNEMLDEFKKEELELKKQELQHQSLIPHRLANTLRAAKDPNCARMFSYSAHFLSQVRHCKADSLTKIRGRIIS